MTRDLPSNDIDEMCVAVRIADKETRKALRRFLDAVESVDQHFAIPSSAGANVDGGKQDSRPPRGDIGAIRAARNTRGVIVVSCVKVERIGKKLLAEPEGEVVEYHVPRSKAKNNTASIESHLMGKAKG